MMLAAGKAAAVVIEADGEDAEGASPRGPPHRRAFGDRSGFP